MRLLTPVLVGLACVATLACEGRIVPVPFSGLAGDVGPDRADRVGLDGGFGQLDSGIFPDATQVDAEPVDAAPRDAGPEDVGRPDTGFFGPFTVEGELQGLISDQVVVQLNGGDDLVLTADGGFTFTATLSDGDRYAVTVATYPTSPLQHCRVDRGQGTVSGENVTDIRIRCAHLAAYPVQGAGWNDWLAADGTGPFDASDSPCLIARAGLGCSRCLHGGELRAFEVPDRQTCSEVTVRDALGAFDWRCVRSGTTVRVLSTGLRPERGVGDLIDFDDMSWHPNSVIVSVSGREHYRSGPQVWWTSPVRDGQSGLTAGQAVSGTVYAIGSNADAQFVIDAPNVTVAIAPTSTLTPSGPGIGILARGADYQWFEGAIDASRIAVGLDWSGVRCSVLRRARIHGAGSRGIYIHDGAQSILLESVVARDNQMVGVDLLGSGASHLSGIHVRGLEVTGNGAEGLSMSFADDSEIDTVRAHANGRPASVALRDIASCRVQVVRVTSGRGTGITLGGATRDVDLTQVVASSNSDRGVDIGVESRHVRMSGIRSSNNGQSGLRLSGVRHSLAGARFFNNGGAGVSIETCDNCGLAGVTSASNATGILASRLRGGFVFDVTAVNNGISGVLVQDSIRVTMMSVVSANNGAGGILALRTVGPTTIADAVAAHNGSWGITLTSSVTFTAGLLNVANGGSSGNPNCRILAGGRGLDAATCMPEGNSDATPLNASSLAGVYAGRVVADDVENSSDVSGAADMNTIVDWDGFENEMRGWGREAAATFPVGGHRGRCGMMNRCRIWDLSLRAADIVLRESRAIPTGDDVLNHSWFRALPPTSQANCDGTVPGSRYVPGLAACRSTILRRAIELSGDGLGNDDLVCGMGETCTFSPNIGSYQGHGGTLSLGLVAPGALTNVRLVRAATNGR